MNYQQTRLGRRLLYSQATRLSEPTSFACETHHVVIWIGTRRHGWCQPIRDLRKTTTFDDRKNLFSPNRHL